MWNPFWGQSDILPGTPVETKELGKQKQPTESYFKFIDKQSHKKKKLKILVDLTEETGLCENLNKNVQV